MVFSLGGGRQTYLKDFGRELKFSDILYPLLEVLITGSFELLGFALKDLYILCTEDISLHELLNKIVNMPLKPHSHTVQIVSCELKRVKHMTSMLKE